jgi:hypothetical protein
MSKLWKPEERTLLCTVDTEAPHAPMGFLFPPQLVTLVEQLKTE